MQLSVTALLIAVAFCALIGCGQTGPLYMPPDEATEAKPDASGAEPPDQPDASGSEPPDPIS
jgi:predicted small lipoprotein YifL